MRSFCKRVSVFLLLTAIVLIVNAGLFMGMPLLSHIQRSFSHRNYENPILLTAHKPPKPPDAEKEKQLREKKPRKIKKKTSKKQPTSKPKIDIPKFDFAMGGSDLSGGLQISMAPKQKDLRASMLNTAFKLSEVDQPPRIIRKLAPLYPFSAKRKSIQGKVTLRFIVTKQGKVIEPSVVKADPEGIFENSAIKAILRWRFKPAIKDGRAVDVVIIAPVKFELKA